MISPLLLPPRGNNHDPEFCGFYILLSCRIITKQYFPFGGACINSLKLSVFSCDGLAVDVVFQDNACEGHPS